MMASKTFRSSVSLIKQTPITRSFSHGFILSSGDTSDRSATTTTSQCPHLQNSSSSVNNNSKQPLKRFDEMPGPKGWPILGNAIELARNASNPSQYYTDLAAKYGEMVRTRVMNEKMVLLSNPHLARILAREEEGRVTFKAGRNYSLEKGYPLVPVFNYNHENWNDMRQVLNVPMKPQYVNEIIIPQLTDMNSELLQEIIKYFKFDNDMQKFYIEDLTMEVTSTYAFGSVLKSILGARLTEDKLSKFGFTIRDYVEDGNFVADLITKLNYLPEIYKFYKTKDYKKMERVLDVGHERINRLLEIYKDNESDKPRLLEFIQERARECNVQHPETVGTCVGSLLTAGTDVTAKVLTIMLYRIATEKEYADRMYNELVEIFGEPSLDEITSKNGLVVTPEHLKQMRLCKNFIDEVLRVDHVLPIRNARKLSKDMELGGYLLEKGTLILFLDELKTQSKFVPRGCEFLPDRHEKGSELSEPKGYLGPFGRGARKCPGERVASTEIFMTLINVVRHFKLEHSNGDKFPPLTADKSIMVMDTKKYRLFFSPRDHLIDHLKQLNKYQ